jgi:hypothetical protein
MGCGCTKNGKYEPILDNSIDNLNNGENKTTFSGSTNIILRILAFILMLGTLPIIMVAIIWFMFELLILNKEMDMKRIVRGLTAKIKPFNEGYVENEDYDDEDDDEDYDDDVEFNEENYEMVDVDDITPVTRK